jgi:hypothetical protein
MTVKHIPEHHKDLLCDAYNNKTHSLKQLAHIHKTSARTIGRVLQERGLATPVPRLKDEAHQVMLLLKKHSVTYPQLQVILKNHALPINPVQNNPVVDFVSHYSV